MNDLLPQGLLRRSGVVLRRMASPEGNLSLYLLLKTMGPQWVSAPGASRGRMRFGGSVEPLVWGNFNLYKGTKRIYLKSVDVSEDFWELRGHPLRLRTLLEWGRLLCIHLIPGHPCDDILAIFYWASIALQRGLPPHQAEWRFLWRWLNAWGLAPSFESCVTCGAQLSGGYWAATGLQCRTCGRGHEGSFIPPEHLCQLSFVAQGTLRAILENTPPSAEGPLWKDGCRRLRTLFEYMR